MAGQGTGCSRRPGLALSSARVRGCLRIEERLESGHWIVTHEFEIPQTNAQTGSMPIGRTARWRGNASFEIGLEGRRFGGRCRVRWRVFADCVALSRTPPRQQHEFSGGTNTKPVETIGSAQNRLHGPHHPPINFIGQEPLATVGDLWRTPPPRHRCWSFMAASSPTGLIFSVDAGLSGERRRSRRLRQGP